GNALWRGCARRSRHWRPGGSDRRGLGLRWILEHDLDETFGAGDHHPIIGDLLQGAAAHYITDRVRPDPLNGRILEEGAALRPLDDDAMEYGLDDGDRDGGLLAPRRVEEILIGDDRVLCRVLGDKRGSGRWHRRNRPHRGGRWDRLLDE